MKTKKMLSMMLSFALVLGSIAGFSPERSDAAETAKKIVVYVAAEGKGASGFEVRIDKTAVQVAEGDKAEVAVKQVLGKHYKDNYQYSDGFLSSIGQLAGSDSAPWVYWGFKVNGEEPQNPDTGWGYGIGDYPLREHDQISLVYGTMEEMPAQCSSYDNDTGLAPGEDKQAEILKKARAQQEMLVEVIYGEIFGAYMPGRKGGPYVPGIEDTDSLYSVFSLAQAGLQTDTFYDNVCRKVLSQFQEMKEKGKIYDPSSGKEITLSAYEGNKSVLIDYTKIALALSALGVDITKAGGINLAEKITDKALYDKANATTLTRESLILFAMNASGAMWPAGDKYVTEKDMVNNLLADVDNQIGISTDLASKWGATLDSAAMVVQALAPYTTKEIEGVEASQVQQVCTKVMKLLSHMQDNKTGGFSGANDNPWTLAQCMITVGLLERDTNPAKDADFIKNGKTLFDASEKYIDMEWQTLDRDLYAYQPDQLLRGVTSCLRRVEGVSLYDTSEPFHRAKTDYILLTTEHVNQISKQIYTGKAVAPEVVVTVNGKKLIKGQDYTLSFHDNIQVGSAYVVVTGTGNYQGSVKVPFQIYKQAVSNPTPGPNPTPGLNPTPVKQVTLKKPVIKKLSSPKKRMLTVTFGKVSKAKKYVVQIAIDKKFKKNVKKKTVSAVKKVTFKKLKAGKKYYVRVRAYRGTVKSPYSKVKSKKVKKK